VLELDHAKKLSLARRANARPLMSCRRGDQVCCAFCDATSLQLSFGQPNKVTTVSSLGRPCDRGINGITGLIVLCAAGKRRDSCEVAPEKALVGLRSWRALMRSGDH